MSSVFLQCFNVFHIPVHQFDGKTVLRINNENQMFGSIHSIDGDKRVFGRFFLGTGTSGLLYGKEAERKDTK